ncbi:MAG: DNA-binding protein, partial [Actinomycetota bacterium]
MAGAKDIEVLSALHVLEYPYRRSVGPVIGRFLTGLRDQKIEGIRASDGRVIVPPVEYDPQTAQELSEFVDVGPGGVVTTWTWLS